MNEWEWGRCNDPLRLLDCAETTTTSGNSAQAEQLRARWDRKMRLLMCAIARMRWDRLTLAAWRHGVQVCERLADDQASWADRNEACNAVQDTYEEYVNDPEMLSLALLAGATIIPSVHYNHQRFTRAGVLRSTQAALVREVFGRSPPTLPNEGASRPSWLTEQVTSLAHAAYDLRSDKCPKCYGAGFGRRVMSFPTVCEICYGCGKDGDGRLDSVRLAILADALDDSGCCEADLLWHLRGREWCPYCEGIAGCFKPGPTRADVWVPCPECQGTGMCSTPVPHFRGCWAVDLLTERECPWMSS